MNQSGTKGRFGAYGLNNCSHSNGNNCWFTNIPPTPYPSRHIAKSQVQAQAPSHLNLKDKKEYIRSSEKKRKFENYQSNQFQSNKRQKL